jgi:hypothetical protein
VHALCVSSPAWILKTSRQARLLRLGAVLDCCVEPGIFWFVIAAVCGWRMTPLPVRPDLIVFGAPVCASRLAMGDGCVSYQKADMFLWRKPHVR